MIRRVLKPLAPLLVLAVGGLLAFLAMTPAPAAVVNPPGPRDGAGIEAPGFTETPTTTKAPRSTVSPPAEAAPSSSPRVCGDCVPPA
jgi:hypothetical protein